jgi:hypothetical protein
VYLSLAYSFQNSDQCLGVLYKLKHERLVFTQRPSSVTQHQRLTRLSDFHEIRYWSYLQKTYKLWFREIGFSESRVV